MSKKYGIGETLPSLTVDLVGGGTLDLPEGLDAKYRVVLFYRGHWWPYCRRQLAGFAALKDQYDELGVKIVASSVDPLDKAQEVADEVNFPIGYGLTKDTADLLGSWWEERRQIIQPSEFIINAETNTIMASSYSDGPLGRIDPPDVVKMVNFVEAQKNK